MEDITSLLKRRVLGNEVIWDSSRAKIILFVNGEAKSFFNLEDKDNNLNIAIIFGDALLNGAGEKI